MRAVFPTVVEEEGKNTQVSIGPLSSFDLFIVCKCPLDMVLCG